MFSPTDLRAIRALAHQDQAGEVDDSYARTGDAEDTIQRWYDSARSAGDYRLVEIIDRIGIAAAARIYEAERNAQERRALSSFKGPRARRT